MWFVVFLAYMGLFAYGLADNARGPIFPDLLRDFGLSDTTGSLFFLVASGAGLVNNPFAFRLMERFGSYRILQAYALIQVVSLWMIAGSPAYALTLLACVVYGTAQGGIGTAVNLMVAEAPPEHLRRRAMAGLHCTYAFASIIAPLLVTVVYSQGFGWRAAVLALSAVSIAVVITSLTRARAAVGTPKRAVGEPVRRLRAWKPSLYYALITSFYVVAEVSIGTRLVLYARRSGYEAGAANLLLSLFFVGLFVGRLSFAVFQIPMRNTRVMALSATVAIVCTSLGLLLSPAWLALTGLAVSVFIPCAFDHINSVLGDRAPFAISLCITLQSLSLMLMHFALGWLADRYGLGAALWIGPMCLVFVLLLLWRERLPSDTALHGIPS